MKLSIKKLSLFLVLIASISQIIAQQNTTLYNMNIVPQRRYLNPALGSDVRFWIGLPVISNFYFNASNSGFAWKDVTQKVGDSIQIDLNKMIPKLKPNNYLLMDFNNDIIAFGFTAGKNYFGLNVTQKFQMGFRYTKDFTDFIWNGNASSLGKELSFDLGINASLYTEYGFTYSREFLKNRLKVGTRIKYLKGQYNVFTETSEISLKTDEVDYSLTAKSNILIHTSGVMRQPEDQDPAKIFLERNNNGWGFDFGGEYDITEKISVSASVIDIGKITWRDYNQTLESRNKSASFTFSGVNFDSFFQQNFDLGQSLDKTLDSMQTTLGLDIDSISEYSSPLPTQFFLGGNYHINEKYNLGALFNGRFIDGKLRPNIGVSLNNQFTKWLGLSVSYSNYNGGWSNLGAGLTLTGPVQFYVITDNILSVFIPENQKNAHVHFGINITPVRKVKDSDDDGVPDKRDKCPDLKGPMELNGCPDKDGDRIIDTEDDCPDQAGFADMKGCPDRDKDGIRDIEDACPEAAGSYELKGCPDTDGDGIGDMDDACPDEVGLESMKGCPDADNDGVADKDDACPQLAGSIDKNGCPDSDNDGVYDNADKCPNEAGVAENEGCPWGDRDNDGILDNEDQCPETAGTKENNGCPIGDLDGDGVNDEVDNCPTEAGPASENGCPIKDADADGIADKDDRCPTVFGDATNSGCPALAVEEQSVLDAAFKSLQFESGKDVILSSSIADLEKLADLLNQKTDWKLNVEGHTDNAGSRPSNLALSQKRAEAVKSFLVNKGVEASRITAKGFGPDKPIADNATAEGKTKNRRVELLISY